MPLDAAATKSRVAVMTSQRAASTRSANRAERCSPALLRTGGLSLFRLAGCVFFLAGRLDGTVAFFLGITRGQIAFVVRFEIRLIPARATEPETCRGHQLSQGGLDALRAVRQYRVPCLLQDIETIAAGIALVLVNRHVYSI